MAKEVCIEGEKGRMCIDLDRFMETGQMDFEVKEKLVLFSYFR